MNPADYMTALRRRWGDVLLAVAVALGAAFVISIVAPPGPPVQRFEATAVLMDTGESSGIRSIQALGSLATLGEVPRRVVESTGTGLTPLQLSQMVKATANGDTGLLEITVISTSAKQATSLANAFVRELLGFVQDKVTHTSSVQAGSLTGRLDGLQEEIRAFDRKIAGGSGDDTILRAQRDAAVRQYGLLYEAYQQTASSAAAGTGVQIIQDAIALPAPPSGIPVPRSRTSLLIIAGILGLVGGVVIVLMLDRLDTRIRNRKDAEEHFDAPVLAEIPFVPRRRRAGLSLATVKHPRSPTADAFRVLSMSLSFVPRGDGEQRGESPRTILVTSPGPADGKTTVVSNLAGAFAEGGKRVLVLSCDLRRPRIHRIFDVPNTTGLSDFLASPEAELNGQVLESNIRGIQVVPSGAPPERPGELLGSERMRRMLAEARSRADVVLIDTAPILTTSDAVGLLTEVDAVLLVARAGRTSGDVAERTAGVLKRLGAPLVGVALNAANEIATPGRNYYYYMRARPKGDRGFPRLARHPKKEESLKW